MRTEKEVDEMIDKMVKRTKGRYLTQGVSFNKTCPRQMELLKKSLMSSVSFSGLAKESLALRFNESNTIYGSQAQGMSRLLENPSQNKTKSKDVGNFL